MDCDRTINGNDAQEYRNYIKELLDKCEWRKAHAEEISGIRDIAKKTGDKRKYDKAIKGMLDYFKCLEAHNLLP